MNPACASSVRVPSPTRCISRSIRLLEVGLHGVEVQCCIFSNFAAAMSSGPLSEANLTHCVVPPKSRIAQTMSAFDFFLSGKHSDRPLPTSLSTRP